MAALVGLEVDKAAVVKRDAETPEGIRTALDTLVIAHGPIASERNRT